MLYAEHFIALTTFCLAPKRKQLCHLIFV